MSLQMNINAVFVQQVFNAVLVNDWNPNTDLRTNNNRLYKY